MSQLLTLGAAFVGAMWGTAFSLYIVKRKLVQLLQEDIEIGSSDK